MKHNVNIDTPPLCPECDSETNLIRGDTLYGRSDLSGKWFWACEACDTRVGCHPGSTQPLGTPAGKQLRDFRARAHAAFDPLWQQAPTHRRKVERQKCYRWLRTELGMTKEECHIGLMNEEQCEAVIALCSRAAREALADVLAHHGKLS